MKFQGNKSEEELLRAIKSKMNNPFSRQDEKSPWAELARIVLRGK